MDHVKRTFRLRVFIVIACTTCIIGAMISHFHQNHMRAVQALQAEKKLLAPIIISPKNIAQNAIVTAEPPKATPVITKTIRFKSSVIDHSLLAAENNAGLTVAMDHELNTMFANQNIAHDIKPGDRLEVLYHEYFENNHKDHPGHIVAAQIVGKNGDFRVVRFAAPNNQVGYYKPNGDGTKPTFLKIPVHYIRIGSHFTYHRFDPILHEVRPHLGVDFDAPEGTPVKAIGNGIVLFCKQMRGYGNVMMIQYNKTYKTLYAHLEKFAQHMRPNEPVKKGEVVGYVGETGWATGPHLHFALYKNGVPINPLTATFPSSSPVPEQYRQAFFAKEEQWFDEMTLFEAAKKAGNPILLLPANHKS